MSLGGLQIAPERNRLQKLNQALEDGMMEERYLGVCRE
jgi:hypothetical protein